MLSFLLVSFLLAPFSLQGETQETPPTAKEAAEVLEKAFKEKNPIGLQELLLQYGWVEDKKVTKAIALGLKHPNEEVRVLALKGLRYNAHKSAFDLLLKQKKNKLLLDGSQTAPEYFMALGQKADKKALPILTDRGRAHKAGDKAIQARILALGRIRDKKSVEALMDFLLASGPRGEHPHIRPIRLSLMTLTGEDYGRDSRAWVDWWNENKRKVKVDSKPPELPKEAAKFLRSTWITPKERQEALRKAEEEKEDQGDQEKEDDAVDQALGALGNSGD
ncbi:MAG: hypothetical protein DWQ01_10585 [Planctomycetota bacterium]|nr:MAG: hypothetical protein DWQ01_10585 [Planctomycetota bacterium]